jgi:hypothetical protein
MWQAARPPITSQNARASVRCNPALEIGTSRTDYLPSLVHLGPRRAGEIIAREAGLTGNFIGVQKRRSPENAGGRRYLAGRRTHPARRALFLFSDISISAAIVAAELASPSGAVAERALHGESGRDACSGKHGKRGDNGCFFHGLLCL